MLGVDQQRDAVDLLRDPHAELVRPQQERAAEPTPLHRAVDGQPAEPEKPARVAAESLAGDFAGVRAQISDAGLSV